MKVTESPVVIKDLSVPLKAISSEIIKMARNSLFLRTRLETYFVNHLKQNKQNKTPALLE